MITIAAVGDIGTRGEPPELTFEQALEPLRSADLRFAQCQRLYSERGSLQQQTGRPGKNARQNPRAAAAFKSVPFDVVSLASNHTGDWGPEADEDTVETFRLLDIATVGTGRDIAAARKPAVLERNGIRVAFLGYVSTTLPQSWATETRAGSAPMRAHTFYEPYEFQPGAPARIVTMPHAADLEQLVVDVKRARQDADLVLVSMHWGVHYVPRPCDYQPVVAHAAIDAGAAVILGHHPHQPQGMEVYKGAPIFYSIGNFSFPPPKDNRHGTYYALPNGEYTSHDIYDIEPDPGFVFTYRRHYDEGGIVFIDADRKGVSRATYLPTLLTPTAQPAIVKPDHPQFEKSLEYLNWAGRFINGGLTQMKATGGRHEVYTR